jgi:hypothetical protein
MTLTLDMDLLLYDREDEKSVSPVALAWRAVGASYIHNVNYFDESDP